MRCRVIPSVSLRRLTIAATTASFAYRSGAVTAAAFRLVRRGAATPAMVAFSSATGRLPWCAVNGLSTQPVDALPGFVPFWVRRHVVSSELIRTCVSGHSNKDSSGDGDADDGQQNIKPTWTYTPYKPQPPSRGPKRTTGGGPGGRLGKPGGARRFSSGSGKGGEWNVPNKITIPLDRIDVTFARSSGAGGQNVNKVNTKVEIRLLLADADWIPGEVRDRIRQTEGNRISKEGYLAVTSQEYRTQAQNRKDAMEKLEEIVMKAWPRPKVRKMRKGISKKAKERNKEDKKRRSQVKSNRKRVDF